MTKQNAIRYCPHCGAGMSYTPTPESPCHCCRYPNPGVCSAPRPVRRAKEPGAS